jgi:adenosylcobyric acid synthase
MQQKTQHRSLMIGGTASHVGKSWLATAICRWLHRRGIRVAPFKAQNMSNNSYPCPGGGEIGRAQVAQAEACGLEPSTDMNPILLKPTSEMGSQVVLQGKVWRNLSARQYYEHYEYLLQTVEESYARLSAEFDFIVIEGAGSIAEVNLRKTDLANLGLARRLQAPVLLVADVDRGGVFASIYGTLALLDSDDASLVRGFAINRFRGDPALFDGAARMLEERAAKPCLGVFPFLDNVHLDEEDSVSLDDWGPAPGNGPSIAIIRFPRVSNFTDFRLLRGACWLQRPLDRQFDMVILPGSKNSISDLQWMRSQGLDTWLQRQHAGGAEIVGICGGYQMLGQRIDDPDHVESAETSVNGLGLLPVTTTLRKNKITNVVAARTPGGRCFSAYEIHLGETTCVSAAEPFAFVADQPEGIRYHRCTGTYLHGALEDAGVLEECFGVRLPEPESKQNCYEQLADWFEQAVDVPLFEELFL